MRLFVAAWPDDATRRRLGALELELGRSKGLRFVGPTRWHVTLRFLGEVDEALVDPVGQALSTAAAAFDGPLECRLGPGTGWFTGVRVLQLPATGTRRPGRRRARRHRPPGARARRPSRPSTAT